MSANHTKPTALHDPAPEQPLVPLPAPLRASLTLLPPVVLPLVALAVASGALAMLVLGQRRLGGLLILLTALLHAAGSAPRACDQSVRRRVAAVIAALADRYADLCILGGLGVWSLAHEQRPAPLAAAFLALTGELVLAYAGARVRASAGADAAQRLIRREGRGWRLSLAALGALTGQAWLALLALAVLTHARVAWVLVCLRRLLR